MKPDWDKLAAHFKGAKSLVIADVDCTKHNDLCGKHGVEGFPTIKVFKKGKKSGEPYNGGRDFNSLKKFVDANLNTGPACSLEAKEECSKEERAILEESEKMTVDQRRTKVKEIEKEIDDKTKQAKELEKEAKKLKESLAMWKAGGEKPDKVEQVLGDAELKEHCESRTCVIAFLPHILDGGAAARNGFLKTLNNVFKKSKGDDTPVGFMWTQGGDQFDIEEKMALQFGFPAVIAINLKKERYGVHRGTFDDESVGGFIKQLMIGRVPLHPIPAGMPKWPKSKPWDGKDGEAPPEEEL